MRLWGYVFRVDVRMRQYRGSVYDGIVVGVGLRGKAGE